MRLRTLLSCVSFTVFAIALSGQTSQVPDNDNFLVTHGPYIQNLSPTGVTIFWTTNKPAIPGVHLTGGKLDRKFIRNSSDGITDGGGTLHKVRIEGLDPATKYSYRIHSVQVLKYQAYKVYYGDTLSGREISFNTAPASADNVKFLVINDVHENSGKLSSYLRNTDLSRHEFCFFNGDMIDFLQDPAQMFRGFIDTASKYFAASKPFIYVRGNHETRGFRAREVKDYFDYPGGKYYYAFSWGKIRFIVLDCGEDKPDNNRYYYGLADYDSYRFEELEWLRKEIAGEDFRNSDVRIVMLHMPAIKQEKQGHGMKFLAENFGPVLKKAGIDLMLSAHTHRNTFYPKDKSGYDYPVLVNSNNSFVEVTAGKDGISAIVKDITGKIIAEYSIK